MADVPAKQVDTSGVYGEDGPAPLGEAPVSGSDALTTGGNAETSVDNTTPPPAATQPDTSGTNSTNTPANYTPTSTLVSGYLDTTYFGAPVHNADPAYETPPATPGGSYADTTRTDHLGTGPAPGIDAGMVMSGYTDTAYFGAPDTTVNTVTESTTLSNAGTQLANSGVLSGAPVTVVDVTATNAALVEGTDYTLTYEGEGGGVTLTITRVGTSVTSADGDTITVTYTYGDQAYWGSNLPDVRPDAPTIGTVTGLDRAVEVTWTPPATHTDIIGYVVEGDTYGTEYAGANATSAIIGNLVPDQTYHFRVSAWNARGRGPASAWSADVHPVNYDEVPTGSLDPKNTGNPIYKPDGTIVSGTGLDIP